MPSLVKVCCITSFDEARMALNAGADFLGLVSTMPCGPGVISLKKISRIINLLPRKTKTVLLTSQLTADSISKEYLKVGSWGLQLVDKIGRPELEKLKKSLPKTVLIQAVHVQDRGAISEALSYTNLVDMLLLDSGNPTAKNRTLEGTGRTHDWAVSQEICRLSSLPVFLAGGLNPDNIKSALSTLHPAGVDVCSGVRQHGLLSKHLVEEFIDKVKDN